jgi:hypothetical protein
LCEGTSSKETSDQGSEQFIHESDSFISVFSPTPC